MNIQKLMKQAQQLQSKLEETQKRIAEMEFSGSSGGGLVTVTMKGDSTVCKVKIEKEAAEDLEVLEDLIVAACRDAQKKVADENGSQMKGVTGGMGLPDLGGMKLPF